MKNSSELDIGFQEKAAGDLEEQMLNDGYAPHHNAIDATIIAEGPCPTCGTYPWYRGFKKGDSYRAFAICGFTTIEF